MERKEGFFLLLVVDDRFERAIKQESLSVNQCIGSVKTNRTDDPTISLEPKRNATLN